MPVVVKIVSGGQTGVDRAALDFALARRIKCGGWCPKGRRAEDGPLDSLYPLIETDTPDYAIRTELNVKDSDGTLIITKSKPSGGTALTILCAKKLKKPCFVVDLTKPSSDSDSELTAWITTNKIKTLNIAGPRESGKPGIYDDAMKFLETHQLF
ncbi:MAG: putative molybdenum carrier protein, partial [Candidatus Lindowbacteria bacterium]|nr:putative molybdenum carrier protein [Candidatus Lindowbacteria bacterium]